MRNGIGREAEILTCPRALARASAVGSNSRKASCRVILTRWLSIGTLLPGCHDPRRRIRLPRREHAELPLFSAWLNDPEVRAHLALIYPMGLAHEEQWFERQLQAEPAAQAFVIEARTDAPAAGAPEPAWQPIGVAGYHAIDWRNRSGELGLLIGEKTFWNAG
jgi:RimJ/RimL family protein N-acetyltransferase